MSENTKNNGIPLAGSGLMFSVFYGRMACKEVILETLQATQGLDADVVALKIQEALRKYDNHCIDDYDVLVILQSLNEEDFISYINEVVLDCECNSFSNDFRQNLIDKLAEDLFNEDTSK